MKLLKVLKNDGNFLFTFLKTFTGSFTTYRHSIYLYLFSGFTCNLLQLQTLLEKKEIYFIDMAMARLPERSTNTIHFLFSKVKVNFSTLYNYQLMRRERPSPLLSSRLVSSRLSDLAPSLHPPTQTGTLHPHLSLANYLQTN